MNTEKLVSTSKKLYTFFKFLRKITLFGMGAAILIMLLITGISLIDPGAVIGESLNTIDIGPLSITIAPEYAPDSRSVLLYSWSLILLGAACAALIYYAFGIILKILEPMTQGQPFAPSVGRHIKKLGYVCLALGAAQNVANILDCWNALHTYKLTELTLGPQITSITATYTVDLTFVILFFVLLLLSHVFQYGAQLQQLSDETL